MTTPSIDTTYQSLRNSSAVAQEAATAALEAGDFLSLSAATIQITRAVEDFKEALDKDTVEIPGKGRLFRFEYEALERLAKDNGLWLGHVLEGVPTIEAGRVKHLGLDGLKVTNISALEPLTEIAVLDLSNNQIRDLSPLQPLNRLRGLYLRSNQIEDLTPLGNLKNLISLQLYWNQIQDLGPLCHLTQLVELEAQGNNIQDLGPLGNLTNLFRLNLSGNQIHDLRPIGKLTQLRWLCLSENQVYDLCPLANFTEANIWLGGNPIQKDANNRRVLKGLRRSGCMIGGCDL